MAPEQAAGDGTATSARPTDVYALGRHPLRAAHRPAAVPRARRRWTRSSRSLDDEPVPPRRLQPKVPRDLETICLKCLRQGAAPAATPAARRWPTTCAASSTASRSRPGRSAWRSALVKWAAAAGRGGAWSPSAAWPPLALVAGGAWSMPVMRGRRGDAGQSPGARRPRRGPRSRLVRMSVANGRAPFDQATTPRPALVRRGPAARRRRPRARANAPHPPGAVNTRCPG